MKYFALKLSLLSLSFLATSCYTTRSIYAGNPNLRQLGNSRASILANYGAPDRQTDDGSGGQILVYEQVGRVTLTRDNSLSQSRVNSAGAVVYGDGATVGASQSVGSYSSSGSSLTQSAEVKAYKQFFVNNQNVVYYVRTNTGDEYSYSKCLNSVNTWLLAGCGLLYWPSLFITVPVATLAQVKAKKNGTICK